MESKKINQLATELAPDLSDLTIIGDPTTGISKKITLSQMASLFTGTVEEYANLAAFPLVGVADTIYVALDTNIIYRYDTSLSAYVILSPNIINSLVFSDANGFDGTITLVGSVATLSITTALTLGSVPFIGASGALTQDNANLFFDDTNNRLGIATALPTTPLDVFGSGIIGRLNATSTNNAFLGFASNGTNKWSAGNVQSDHRFRIFSEANSAELITILQTGEFGIGIANPTTKFHIDGAASALIANLDANVSIAKSVSYRSDNSARINLEVSGTESGSNAGADFFLRTFTDAGSLLATPITITRSTGAISLATALSGTSASFSSTATATAFIPSGATIPTNGMYLSAANTLNFATNTTNRLTITSAGDVGINTAGTLAAKLHITAASSTSYAPMIALRDPDNPTYGFTFKLDTAVNGDMRIDRVNLGVDAAVMSFQRSTGNVGISTNSPAVKFEVAGSGSIGFFRNPSSTAATTFITVINANNTSNGLVMAHISDGTGYFGTQNSADLKLVTGDTERMRIAAAGNMVYSNAPANTFAARFEGNSTTGQSFGLQVWGGTNSSDTSFRVLNVSSVNEYFKIRGDGLIQTGTSAASPYNNTSGAAANMIVTSGGTLERSTSSLKYKTDIVNYDKGLAEVLKMRPVYYKSINEREKDLRFAGLIAEEIEGLGLTEFVQYAEDGTPDALSYSNMVSLLTKAIQEQQAQIEELKALIAAK